VACALDERSARVRTQFIEFRQGSDPAAMRAEVEALRPHVVVVFRPDLVPPGLFAGLRAATLGFLTEPVPRSGSRRSHSDLQRRRAELARMDAGNFDRIVSFDPLIVPTADEFKRVWRSLPLPVTDRLYAPVRPIEGRARLLFVGRSTAHRERLLTRVKHEFDLTHIAFGVAGDDLDVVMATHDVAINLHNEPYPSFENRVCLHLAAGHLVISEPLVPTHGLEPGVDYLEAASAPALLRVGRELYRYPNAYQRIRVRGRRKAEDYRASRVYPRLVEDLWRDLAAFGTERA